MSLDVLKGRRVLLTGHTGFKGGWMALWLHRLGAEVVGVALPPPEGPSLFQAVRLADVLDHRIGDIRSPGVLSESLAGVDAELVVHMAAQAIVRQSYEEPLDTYLTNVVGTAAVLDAARAMPSLRAVVVVTSDKCYENHEWVWGYRENDPMGGADPYSSSKGCTELVVGAYRRSFFNRPGGPLLASVRAGNVIGGGDWAKDRIIPDIVRAVMAGQPATIRNPASIRPWQHVLEPVAGYLQLAAALLQGEARFADGWNFGPDPDGICDVRRLADLVARHWGEGGPSFQFGETVRGPHEAGTLKLDSTKARALLGWRPRLDIDAAIRMTVDWYRAYAQGEPAMRAVTEAQIDSYSEMIPCA